ncbi:MAG: outer membrane protein transport protein [Robiginitomaculum sp.]|nr:outer membrane protein transport protein [Robiginitomaculum sp.]
MALLEKKTIRTSFAALWMSGALVAPALATEGYFQHGTGARAKALAGAGVADTRDAAGMALNPAGLLRAGTQAQISLSAFQAKRGFTGSGGPGFTPSGEVDSVNEWFPIPNLAYSHRISDKAAWGIVVVANGGLNTTYAPDVANPVCGSGPFPSSTGVFCDNGAGVDLNQVFIQPTFAYQLVNGLSVGVAPVLAVQRFEARGLAIFGGLSVDPANLTDNGQNWSTGIGVKVGVDIDTGTGFRIGASYQPKINMSRFDRYRGLFADGGDFDVPSNWTVGVAWDVADNVTALFDVRHIDYSGVGSVGNSSSIPNFFGNFGGPGFGWNDVTAYKFGVEWRRDAFTWRAGFAHNNNPIDPEDVTLNILAPGVIENHITGGFSYAVNEGNSFDFALLFAPNNTVRGEEVIPGGPPGHFIELELSQIEITFGWTFKFGE